MFKGSAASLLERRHFPYVFRQLLRRPELSLRLVFHAEELIVRFARPVDIQRGRSARCVKLAEASFRPGVLVWQRRVRDGS